MNDEQEGMQTRELRGEEIRSGHTISQAIGQIQAANLRPSERSLVIEYVECALTADRREALGGAAYLTRCADDIPDRSAVAHLRPLLERLAGRFIR